MGMLHLLWLSIYAALIGWTVNLAGYVPFHTKSHNEIPLNNWVFMETPHYSSKDAWPSSLFVQSVCLLFHPQWSIFNRIQNLVFYQRNRFKRAWGQLRYLASSPLADPCFLFALAWWHEPHTLLQEFTSLPAVIPRTTPPPPHTHLKPTPGYTDVSFMVLLKQNSLAPSPRARRTVQSHR